MEEPISDAIPGGAIQRSERSNFAVRPSRLTRTKAVYVEIPYTVGYISTQENSFRV